ncbi:GDSL-type esterase/lipase family protein [Jiulongibacter sp. NS-SX5]|uniref:GDSL-type esterase/lipase family protein n=1 Tax=Jiulongibacter sp. NS-SX5 TaxID=3463854 RepID=UPI004057F678
MKNVFFLFVLTFLLGSCDVYKKYADSAEQWENEVTDLEFQDDIESYSDDAILFIGSSSIRLWKTIEEDMAPYEPIRRGYGGAHFYDLIHFTKRLVWPHEFQALCIFVANDITGGENDLTVNETMRLFKEVVASVRQKYPDVPIFPIAVTPTSSRWEVWPEVQKLNAAMKSYCEKKDHMYFINPSDRYLNEKGMPRDELFIRDKLHLNEDGYDIWAEEIKVELDKVLK